MAKITLYHDTRSGKEEFPIKLRIAHKKETAYINLGIKVAPEDWSEELGMVIKGTKAKSHNETIIARLGKAMTILTQLDLVGKTNKLTASQIKEAIENNGEIVEKKEGNKFYDYYVSCMNSKSTEKTRSSYNQALVNLEKFDEKLKDRSFEDMDIKYIERFDDWFEQRGVSINARAVYYRNIRSVFNDAVDEQLTENYPFRKFKIKKTPTKKRNLSVEELRLLKDFQTDYGMHAKYRDIFMLMFYLRGINAVDLFRAKDSDVRLNRLNYTRSKTGQYYSVKIEPEAWEIINKYKGKDYLIDICDGAKDEKEWTAKYDGFLHRMDRGLKKIGPITWSKGIGSSPIFKPILPFISQYWCRHTSATLMAELGQPNEIIAASLGHEYGNKTTNIYIEIDQKKVDIANRQLIDYVNGKKKSANRNK